MGGLFLVLSTKPASAQSTTIPPSVAETVVGEETHERGFIYREIRFGTLWNRKTGEWDYRRVEVFKATPWTQRERQRIWGFFKAHRPKQNLGIFVIHENKLYMYPVEKHSGQKGTCIG